MVLAYNGGGSATLAWRTERGALMQVVFRLAYALVVAILLILFAILGIRVVYPEPDEPSYPYGPVPAPAPGAKDLYCNYDGTCYADGKLLTTEAEAELTEEQRDYVREMRNSYARQRDYEEERRDYRRNVLIAAAALGALAVACGLFLYRRVEAMPLGLLLGGLGVVIYGWAQAGDEFDEMGPTVPFLAVGLGLAAVLAAGYYFLGLRGALAGESTDG